MSLGKLSHGHDQDRWWERPPYVEPDEIREIEARRQRIENDPRAALDAMFFEREVIRLACPNDPGHQPIEILEPTMNDIERRGRPPVKIMCDCAFLPGSTGADYLTRVWELVTGHLVLRTFGANIHRSQWPAGVEDEGSTP